MNNKPPDYLQESREWVFRMYTVNEVCRLLKITRVKFYMLRNEGLFVPMTRKVEYRMKGQGISYYTDRQIFEAIIHMHPDIAEVEVNYLAHQLMERRNAQEKDAKRKYHRRYSKRKRSVCPAETKTVWREIPGSYTPRNLSRDLSGIQDVRPDRQDRQYSDQRDAE